MKISSTSGRSDAPDTTFQRAQSRQMPFVGYTQSSTQHSLVNVFLPADCSVHGLPFCKCYQRTTVGSFEILVAHRPPADRTPWQAVSGSVSLLKHKMLKHPPSLEVWPRRPKRYIPCLWPSQRTSPSLAISRGRNLHSWFRAY